MNKEEYIEERVNNQIIWYDTKSVSYQKKYKYYRFTSTLIALVIPFASGFIEEGRDWLKYAIGIGGIIIALIEFLLSTNKYQELWIEYRTTAEKLKREKIYFEQLSEKYLNSKNPFQNFVLNAERIMTKENEKWMETIEKSDKSTGKNI